jgi:RNA polymerase sigma-70 factor (ECF subfamily)
MPHFKKNLYNFKKMTKPPVTHQDFSHVAASNPKEKDLLVGLKRKEEWAYRQLIDQWAEKMNRVAFHFLGKKEDAEEIVQEVLQKVVEKIDTFAGASSLYTWLYRIAVNQALMRLRKAKGKVFVSWEDQLPSYEHGIRIHSLGDWFRVPEDLLAQKEVQDFLGQCIDQLPEDLKVAYLLKDVEDLSEGEVCKILELTKPTMKNRVHRARLILREQMEKKYVL